MFSLPPVPSERGSFRRPLPASSQRPTPAAGAEAPAWSLDGEVYQEVFACSHLLENAHLGLGPLDPLRSPVSGFHDEPRTCSASQGSFHYVEAPGVSNLWPVGRLWPRMAKKVARHKIIHLLKTFCFADQFSLVLVYFTCGPRQLFFLCGPETPKVGAPSTVDCLRAGLPGTPTGPRRAQSFTLAPILVFTCETCE